MGRLVGNKPKLGARWDEPCQDLRLRQAYEDGLIDFVEASYPIIPGKPPGVGTEVPVYVHCPINPIASPQGVNRELAAQVRKAADEFNSPWIGEHLCWAGPGREGRLGYIITPILCDAFVEVAIKNARELFLYYGRPIALEWAPVYQRTGDMISEIHFHQAVAEGADCLVIFDVAHWLASNRNLGRPDDYGMNVLQQERIVELHVAGIRPSSCGHYWHDSHERVPDDTIIGFTTDMVRSLPALRAVTFEYDQSAPDSDFFHTLERLRHAMC